MKRNLICGLIFIATMALIGVTGCNGGTSEWTVYDVQYADAQVYDVTTCTNVSLQGNHYGWEDPQPDHGNDGDKHGPNWRKWWKKWCDKNGKPKPKPEPCPEPEPTPEPVCDTELYDIPAYFILRHVGLATLYVNAGDLLVLREEMTLDDTLVALHYMDLQNLGIRFYPDFLFDYDGNIFPEAYLEWVGIK